MNQSEIKKKTAGSDHMQDQFTTFYMSEHFDASEFFLFPFLWLSLFVYNYCLSKCFPTTHISRGLTQVHSLNSLFVKYTQFADVFFFRFLSSSLLYLSVSRQLWVWTNHPTLLVSGSRQSSLAQSSSSLKLSKPQHLNILRNFGIGDLKQTFSAVCTDYIVCNWKG